MLQQINLAYVGLLLIDTHIQRSSGVITVKAKSRKDAVPQPHFLSIHTPVGVAAVGTHRGEESHPQHHRHHGHQAQRMIQKRQIVGGGNLLGHQSHRQHSTHHNLQGIGQAIGEILHQIAHTPSTPAEILPDLLIQIVNFFFLYKSIIQIHHLIHVQLVIPDIGLILLPSDPTRKGTSQKQQASGNSQQQAHPPGQCPGVPPLGQLPDDAGGEIDGGIRGHRFDHRRQSQGDQKCGALLPPDAPPPQGQAYALAPGLIFLHQNSPPSW